MNTGTSPHGVFCDYLTATCSPESSFVFPLLSLLRDHLVCKVEVFGEKTLVRFPGPFGQPALVRFDLNFHKRVDRVMFGGASLAVLRAASLLGYVVQEVSAVAHNLTRVDVALDVPLADPSVYQPTLQGVIDTGHAGNLCLSRKSIAPHMVKPIIKPRALDGVVSGSVMLGHRANTRSGIVYDKTAQLHEQFGVIIGENVLRYEMRTTDGSLRDVLDGDSLFFSMASPDLLPCPAGIMPWTKVELPPMNLEPLPSLTEWQKIARIIDFSPDIELLLDLLEGASEPTRRMAQRRLNDRITARMQTGGTTWGKTA